MTTASNNFNGGTFFGTVTTGNSGGSSGSAFNEVNKAAGSNIAYALQAGTIFSFGGAFAAEFTASSATSAYLRYTTAMGSKTAVSGRAYLYYNGPVFSFFGGGTTNPTAEFDLVRILNASDASLARITLGSDLVLRTRTGTAGSNALVSTGPSAIPLNKWLRLEWQMYVSNTAGHILLRVFDGGASTPLYFMASNFNLNTGVGPATKYDIGICTTSKPGTFQIDDINWADIADAPPPPPPSDTTPPSVPTGLIATVKSTSAIDLSWAASTDNVGVSTYKVYRDTFITPIATVTGSFFSDTGLTAATLYTYKVAAVDAAGNTSAQSVGTSATTTAAVDSTPPTVPTGLTATAISTTEIDLAWNASTDAVGVTGYRIYRDGGTTAYASVTSGITYKDFGVTQGSTHSYTVSAFDAAGNESAKSSSASGTAVSSVTLSVADVSAAEGTSTGLTNYTVPVTLSGAITTDVRFTWFTGDRDIPQLIGTAVPEVDYVPASGIATIPAGQTTVNFTVQAYGDGIDEPNETFIVVITEPADPISGQPHPDVTILRGEAVITIQDDDVTPSSASPFMAGWSGYTGLSLADTYLGKNLPVVRVDTTSWQTGVTADVTSAANAGRLVLFSVAPPLQVVSGGPDPACIAGFPSWSQYLPGWAAYLAQQCPPVSGVSVAKWTKITDGSNNSGIDNLGTSLNSLGREVIFILSPNPHNSASDLVTSGTAGTSSDYRAAVAQIRNRWVGKGILASEGGKVLIGYAAADNGSWSLKPLTSGTDPCYPGDTVVDVLAHSTFNSSSSQWAGFSAKWTDYVKLAKLQGKKLIGGTGSVNSAGGFSRDQWFRDAASWIKTGTVEGDPVTKWLKGFTYTNETTDYKFINISGSTASDVGDGRVGWQDAFTNDNTFVSTPLKLGTGSVTGGNPGVGNVVSTTSTVNTLDTPTLVISRPANVATDDVLIGVLQTANGLINHTLPTGWTLVDFEEAPAVTGISGYVVSRVVVANEPANYTFIAESTSGGMQLAGTILAVRGIDTTTPVTAENSATATAGNQITAPSVTGVADGLLISAFISGDPVTLALPSGMTLAASYQLPADFIPGTAGLIAYTTTIAGATGAKTSTYTAVDGGLGADISFSVALKPTLVAPPPPPPPPPVGGVLNPPVPMQGAIQYASRTSSKGALSYGLYIPSTYTPTGPKVPLIVGLHGGYGGLCNKPVPDPHMGNVFAGQTRLPQWAEANNFIVLLPEQSSSRNPWLYWSWFQVASQGRNNGETFMIGELTQWILTQYNIDTTKVFLMGLSAGAAMCMNVAAGYPDVFAGLASSGGLGYKCGDATTSAPEPAYNAMGFHNCSLSGIHSYVRTATDSGNQIFTAMGVNERPLKIIATHGLKDKTVHPDNIDYVETSWVQANDRADNNADDNSVVSQGTVQKTSPGTPYTVTTFKDSTNTTVVETWRLTNSDHGWSAPVAISQDYTVLGPDLTEGALNFFEVAGPASGGGAGGGTGSGEVPGSNSGVGKCVGITTTVTAADDTDINIGRPVGALVGHVLIAVLQSRRCTVTTPSGWTLIDSYVNTSPVDLGGYVFRRTVDASTPSSFTFTGASPASGSSLAGTILAFKDIDTTTPISAFAKKSDTTGDQITAPTVNGDSGGVLVTAYLAADPAQSVVPANMTNASFILVPTGTSHTGSQLVTYQALTATAATGTRNSTHANIGGGNGIDVAFSVALKPASVPSGGGGVIPGVPATGQHTTRTANGRQYIVYIPTGLPTTAVPLVLALPGCTQSATDFQNGTGWSQLAQANKFIVAYPNDSGGCWNSGAAGDWCGASPARSSTIPTQMVAIVNDIKTLASIDNNKVYICGLSSGAAVAVLTGVVYPDVFAAIGSGSGLAYRYGGGCSLSLPAPTTASVEASASQAVTQMAANKHRLPIYVATGGSDQTVKDPNADRIVLQFIAINDIIDGGTRNNSVPATKASTVSGSTGGNSYTIDIYNDGSSVPVVKYLRVNGLGHTWFGGNSSVGQYITTSGPSEAQLMYEFFLANPKP